jgi:thioredoxin reductase
MAVDTPAKIAILGAGPIGLEAALYARFLGYEVAIYERGRAVENVRQMAHVKWFTPFGENVSPLGRAALEAQGEHGPLPAIDALLTAGELMAAYWAPLAQSDLLIDGLREHTEVLAVGRGELLKGELAGDEARREFPFRLLLRGPDHREWVEEADVVIDATGVQPNAWGAGGIAVPNAAAAHSRVEHGLPDVLGSARSEYAGKHTLVIGAGFSAATNVVALAELAGAEPATRITWLVRREGEAGPGFPVVSPSAAPAAQLRLAERANGLAAAGQVKQIAGRSVASVVVADDGALEIGLSGEPGETLTVDRVLSNVGSRPDWSITKELQMKRCGVTDRPSLESGSMVTSEPDFYVIGAKSCGRDGRFVIADGLEQVRQVFSVIGDRADLNLYATIGRARL